MKTKLILLLSLFILIVVGCKKSAIIKQTGYLVFNQNEVMCFVPAYYMSKKSSTASFYSINLGVGISFPSYRAINDSTYNVIYAHADTFNIYKMPAIYKHGKTTMLLPVYIEYTLDTTDMTVKTDWWNIDKYQRKVHIKYRWGRHDIIKITPLPYKEINRIGTYYEKRSEGWH
jgi:hypothetical protein